MAESVSKKPELDPGFEAYQALLEPMNAQSPQELGLEEDEYQNALKDPDTVTTAIRDELGRVHEIPHLAPVRAYNWLNTDFYERTFPEASGRGAVRHLLNIPNLEPGGEVRTALHGLAESSGVLVFDYPEHDPDASARIQSLLSAEGIQHGPVGEIGTQTYYAGKVTLKRKPYDPSSPVMGLHEAFRAMLLDGTVGQYQLLRGASYQSIIDAGQAERMRQLYENAFMVLNDHPCRQGIDDAEFRRLMVEDQEVAKLVCSVPVDSGNGVIAQPATVCLLGEDLDKYPWLNTKFYEREIPAEYASRQILYFPAIATDPQHQGEHKTADVVNLIAQMVEYGNNEIVVAFDCCDFNKDVFPLAAVLEDLINATPEANIHFQVIGMQTYAAVQLYPAAA